MSEQGRVYEGKLKGDGLSFGIVVARFNEFISSRLLSGALDSLVRHGADPAKVEVAWVPGAFEIPLVAGRMAHSGRYDAVLCLARSFVVPRRISTTWRPRSPRAWPR